MRAYNKELGEVGMQERGRSTEEMGSPTLPEWPQGALCARQSCVEATHSPGSVLTGGFPKPSVSITFAQTHVHPIHTQWSYTQICGSLR